jgi:hypothetical protein
MGDKIIRDLVHGYILIDSYVESIINTENFQRLKDIRQLTAQHVFPSATHNRFEHSLGVMYLANKAFQSLRTELLSGMEPNEYDRLHMHLITASILHDIGHAPFSHLGEKYYQKKDQLRQELNAIIDENKVPIDKNIFSHGAKHELMSCYVILKKYYSIISTEFNKFQMELDIELICRCIVGATYDDYRKPGNILINLLNSQTIDADKLDYLMRDAFMTGMDVPPIDTTRLFKNITINPNTNSVTFFHRALPVIQNIVEARDNMYLWVYNHHITVYTDFIMEYYIKHLILNYEANHKFEDKLDPNMFFSTTAITNKMISDSDLWAVLKAHLTKNIPPNQLSAYTQRVFPQLYARKYLSPIWKTIYEFRNFINNNIDGSLKNIVISKLGDQDDYKTRVAVAKDLINRCGLNLGELFVIPRSNKFYSLNPDTIFTVYMNNRETNIDELLPQKDYGEMYNKVGFYIFCRKDKKEQVIEEFKNIVRQPFNYDLTNISETPNFLL